MTTVTNRNNMNETKTINTRMITSPYRKGNPKQMKHVDYLWENRTKGPRLDNPVNYDALVAYFGFSRIVDNYMDGICNGDEDFCASLAQQAVLDGRVDLTAVNDRFHWWWERGIELELLDKEDRIEWMESELEAMEDKGKRWRAWLRRKGNPESKAKFDEFIRRYKAKRADHRRYVTLVDSSFLTEEDTDRTPTLGEALEAYLKMYIDKMSLGQLVVAMEEIEQWKNHKGLSWYYYVQCGMAISYRLAMNTPQQCGWWEVCDRMRKHNQTHHAKVASPTSEDRMHGQAGVSIDRIDDIMCVERLAERHELTAQEVLLTWDDEDQAELTGGESVWEAMLAQAQVG